MEEHVVVMAVASYRSKTAVRRLRRPVDPGRRTGQTTAAGVLEKGADGAITLVRHHSAGSSPTHGTELLGAALIVVAAPMGILLLARLAVTQDAWVRVAALVDHLWHGLPGLAAPHGQPRGCRSGLRGRRRGGPTAEAVGGLLPGASACIVTDYADTDLAIQV